MANLTEAAYDMPTGMLLYEAGRQFAMVELVHDGWRQALYDRGGWFLLLVWAERTCGVGMGGEALPDLRLIVEQMRADGMLPTIQGNRVIPPARNAGVMVLDSETFRPSHPDVSPMGDSEANKEKG